MKLLESMSTEKILSSGLPQRIMHEIVSVYSKSRNDIGSLIYYTPNTGWFTIPDSEKFALIKLLNARLTKLEKLLIFDTEGDL